MRHDQTCEHCDNLILLLFAGTLDSVSADSSRGGCSHWAHCSRCVLPVCVTVNEREDNKDDSVRCRFVSMLSKNFRFFCVAAKKYIRFYFKYHLKEYSKND